MNKNDTVLMLEGINEDIKQGLRMDTPGHSPENTGDGPARVLRLVIGPRSHHWRSLLASVGCWC